MKNSIYIFLFALLIFSCSQKEEANAESLGNVVSNDVVSLNDAQIKNSGIEVGTLKDENISNKIRLNGTIDVPPQNMASVSAPSGGYVRVSRFMPGNYVAKGQTLAVLENPDLVQLQQDYLLAKSNLSYANKDYQRQKELNQSKASSDKVTQKAENEVSTGNIMMKGMAEKLRILGINPNTLTANNIKKNIAVVAPISGYVSSVNVNLGQYVSPTDKMFDIVNTDNVHLMLKVFEKDLNKITIGQNVEAYTNENPEKKFPAKVILINKDFSPDRSVLVHCHFLGYEPHLIAGTFMNADLEIDTQNGYVISDDAIVTWEDQQYIFEEIKPKTYKMTPVKIGNSENSFTELVNFTDALASKKYVTKGAYQLLMALKNVEE